MDEWTHLQADGSTIHKSAYFSATKPGGQRLFQIIISADKSAEPSPLNGGRDSLQQSLAHKVFTWWRFAELRHLHLHLQN